MGRQHSRLSEKYCNTDENGELKSVSLKLFRKIRSIGKGSFGKVCAVQCRINYKLYALKYINKRLCLERNAALNAIDERNILEIVSPHPFLVNMYFAFQDRINMYLVLDFMPGGDLKYHLKLTGSFCEDSIKIIAAELVCAILHIHSKAIVHRDIKPDNILLDTEGHVHLTDFNVAARLPKDENANLHSKSGTICYMAPEVLDKKQGYRESCDWWSLGIVLFELAFGKRPFKGIDALETSELIRKKSVLIKQSDRSGKNVKFSAQFLDLLNGLLVKDPLKRINDQNIKDHSFFSDLNWKDVYNQKIQPLFVPNPKKSHFNLALEGEESALEEDHVQSNNEFASNEIFHSYKDYCMSLTKL